MNADAAASWLEQALAAEQPKDALRMAEKAQSMCSTSEGGALVRGLREIVRILTAGATHYQVLEVPRSTPIGDTQTFTSAYKRVIRVVHPDRCQAPGAAAAATRLNEANDTLSDVNKRRAYDQQQRGTAGGVPVASYQPRPPPQPPRAPPAWARDRQPGQPKVYGQPPSGLPPLPPRPVPPPGRRKVPVAAARPKAPAAAQPKGPAARVVEEERERVPTPPPCPNSMCCSDRKELKKMREEDEADYEEKTAERWNP